MVLQNTGLKLDQNVDMRHFCFLLATILLLNACSSSRNWRRTSNWEGTQAEFDKHNGKQAFTILVPDNDTYLKYHLTIDSGKLETIIKSPKEMILSKEFGTSVADSIHIVNQKGAKYKIYLKGKQASGGFDIRFTNGLD